MKEFYGETGDLALTLSCLGGTSSAHEEGRKTGLHQAAILLRGEAERVLKVEHLPIVERQRRSTHLRRLAATVETLK